MDINIVLHSLFSNWKKMLERWSTIYVVILRCKGPIPFSLWCRWWLQASPINAWVLFGRQQRDPSYWRWTHHAVKISQYVNWGCLLPTHQRWLCPLQQTCHWLYCRRYCAVPWLWWALCCLLGKQKWQAHKRYILHSRGWLDHILYPWFAWTTWGRLHLLLNLLQLDSL